MKTTARLALALIAAAMLSAPTMAAGGYVPLGPKVYTPQPDVVIPQPDIVTPQAPTVTPQADTVTVTGGGIDTHGGSSEPMIGNPNPNGSGWWNAKCKTIANVNADCVALSMMPGTGGTAIPLVTTVTANPDLVTANPDLVTPQAPIVIPQPDTCSQKGWSRGGGFGNYSC